MNAMIEKIRKAIEARASKDWITSNGSYSSGVFHFCLYPQSDSTLYDVFISLIKLSDKTIEVDSISQHNTDLLLGPVLSNLTTLPGTELIRSDLTTKPEGDKCVLLTMKELDTNDYWTIEVLIKPNPKEVHESSCWSKFQQALARHVSESQFSSNMSASEFAWGVGKTTRLSEQRTRFESSISPTPGGVLTASQRFVLKVFGPGIDAIFGLPGWCVAGISRLKPDESVVYMRILDLVSRESIIIRIVLIDSKQPTIPQSAMSPQQTHRSSTPSWRSGLVAPVRLLQPGVQSRLEPRRAVVSTYRNAQSNYSYADVFEKIVMEMNTLSSEYGNDEVQFGLLSTDHLIHYVLNYPPEGLPEVIASFKTVGLKHGSIWIKPGAVDAMLVAIERLTGTMIDVDGKKEVVSISGQSIQLTAKVVD